MESEIKDYEKLGVFYLGRERDMEAGQTTSNKILYDSKDLTTHAVVVGMTGSGKTGLCLNLLEEAAMDRIPALVIDPKGDIANLLLTFPDLAPADFVPWVDEGQASREGKSREEFAASEAAKWKSGLQKWEIDGERIRRMREAVELRVYTPGSTAGRPLTVLKSFHAPEPEVREDSDLFRERISSAASGLLALLGIDADPIRSREHILISQILNTAWSDAKDLDLGKLIGQIQAPPFQKVGIMEIDAFFPAKERMELAMTLNNLLASPSFASWMEGESLNVKSLLHTPEGKPCISILSISHLNDAERMFLVTLVLNELLGWMRGQSGTSSLRAIFYMDEVFGYFPPSKIPPSKPPMLTLLKQARAFGLGIVLATQNPVDLDYKGLGNTGTWFLGRLQTERDKMRVIEGLEGAASQAGASFDRNRMEQLLAGLGSRIFLLNNAHDDRPVVFETRWAMSYLRGPMTRQEIQKLVPPASRGTTAAKPATGAAEAAAARPGPDRNRTKVGSDEDATEGSGFAVADSASRRGDREEVETPEQVADPSGDPRQAIPAGVAQRFAGLDRRPGEGETLHYQAGLFGRGRVHFVKSNCGIDLWEERRVVRVIDEDDLSTSIWDEARLLPHSPDWSREPDEPSVLAPVPAPLQSARNLKAWEKSLKEFLYRAHSLTLFRCAELDMTSKADESEGEFRIRIETAVSELRDRETEKMRQKYAARFQQMRDQIDRAQATLEKETAQYQSRRVESVLSVGGSLLGALLGRRAGRSSAVKSVGVASREKQDVQQAEANMETLQNKFRDLEIEFNESMSGLAAKLDSSTVKLETIEIPPRKSDLTVEEFFVAWLPWIAAADGSREQAWGG